MSEYLVILTLDVPGPGASSGTVKQTVTSDSGTTRSGLFIWALEQFPEEMRRGKVVFFYAEPNQYTASPATATAASGGAQ